MDAQLVEKIVHEVKSQGVFDEFRKDSIADVDTKPAYQNLRQRVENTVKKFLSEQKWSLETNKNQLREKLRRHITESGFLDVGVERIVDQVVNPKIGSVFQPRIEEIAYKYLGLPPPPKKFDPPPPPLMHPLPPLPLNAPPLKIETSGLLPTDLEQVSPDSDNVTVKSEGGDDRTTIDMDTEDKLIEDEDESPPFEPLVKYEEKESKVDVKTELQEESNINQELVVPLSERPNRFDDSTDADIKTKVKGNETDSPQENNFAAESAEMDKEASQSVDARISQDSQLSSVSSDSRLSPNPKDESLLSSSQEAVAANISEEAQMPKFNENSCEQSIANGNVREKDIIKSEFHFDIKKDEIKFEGTERKIGLETFESLAVKSEEERFSSAEDMNMIVNKNESFNFVTGKMDIEMKEEDGERTPNAQELSFGSSIEDSSSVPPSQTLNTSTISKEKLPLETHTLENVHPTTSSAILTQTPYIPMPPATPSPVMSQKPEKDHQSRYSSSSSSKHKKHSKERRRSHDREKDKDSKDRHRSGKETRDSYKYHSSSGTKSGNKHSSSSSSTKSYSSNSKNTEKDIEKSSSSSAHSSSKHTKHSNSHSSSSSIENQEYKKMKRDSERRHHSSSSSKRSERKDDHTEAKQKLHRRKTDSNDDDDDNGNKSMGGGKSIYHSKPSSSFYEAKSSKSSAGDNKSSSCKINEYQKGQMETKEYTNESYGKMQPINNVVILNDLLENPQTQFIQLSNKGHVVEMPHQQHKSPVNETDRNEIAPTEFDNNIELQSVKEKHELDLDLESRKERENEMTFLQKNMNTENEANSNNLLYFEQINFNIKDRLEAINAAMDLYRSAVNSLRFDSMSDEGIDLSNEEDVNSASSKTKNTLTDSLKRKSEYSFDEFVRTPRKRIISNESESPQSKPSPTPSDTSSVNSKENEEIYKNPNRAKKSLLDPATAIQKLSQQQRYSSEDLYKPRPVLGQRSRRRGIDSLV